MGHVEGFAGQRQAFTVTVYTDRKGVNVIIPGRGIRLEGNHRYERPKGAVSTWITRLIAQTIDGDNIGCVRRGYTVGAITSIRAGKYTAIVWIPKHDIPQRVIASHGHGHHTWHVIRADGIQFALTWKHETVGHIGVRTFDPRTDDNAQWVEDYTYLIVDGVQDKPLREAYFVAAARAEDWIDMYGPLFV